MRKKWRKTAGRILTCLVLLFSVSALALAFSGEAAARDQDRRQDTDYSQIGDLSDGWKNMLEYTNPETGYRILLEDDAGLLTSEQAASLAERMKRITAWGNVAFKSIDENPGTTKSYIESYYREQFGRESGTIFLIDMDQRNIWLKNDGRISKVITNSYSDTITDNVYRSASRGDYYGCAMEAYIQIETLLSGNRIAQPMKYISNALLALILALLINFFIMRFMGRSKMPSQKERLSRMRYHYSLTNTHAKYIRTSERYDPVSSDSGGSSGGGGGGGGGSSGSGGGHSF